MPWVMVKHMDGLNFFLDSCDGVIFLQSLSGAFLPGDLEEVTHFGMVIEMT